MVICVVVDESQISVRGLAALVLFDLLLPVGIPPSELSDTCKTSHSEFEINMIDRIEPRSWSGACDARRW